MDAKRIEKECFIFENYTGTYNKCDCICKCCGNKFTYFKPARIVEGEKKCKVCGVSNKDNLEEYKELYHSLRRYNHKHLCDKEGNVYSVVGGLHKLKGYVDDSGYVLYDYAKGHQIVMKCWGTDKPKGSNWCIRHLNDIKSDNRISNLKWGTTKWNMEDKKCNQLKREEAIKKVSDIIDLETLSILTALPVETIKGLTSA